MISRKEKCGKKKSFNSPVSEYQESVIEMARGISRERSIKMLYGFARRLYKEEKAGN